MFKMKKINFQKGIFVTALAISLLLPGCSSNSTNGTAPTTNTDTQQEQQTDTSVENTTEEAIDITESDVLGDFYEYLGTISEDLAYTISPLAKDFINQNPALFPCKDKKNLEKYIDSSLEYKMIAKNQNKYGDKLMYVSAAYVVNVAENNYEDGTSLTEIQAIDEDANMYYVIYVGTLDDIYQEDAIEIYGSPIGMTSYENVSGGTTIPVVIAGSYIEKIQ